MGIRKILPQTTKLTDTNNIESILQIDALITFTEKDLRSLALGVASFEDGFRKNVVELEPVFEKSGEAAYTTQCIHLDEELLVKGGYKAFLDERRRLIAAHLNTFLGVAQGGS